MRFGSKTVWPLFQIKIFLEHTALFKMNKVLWLRISGKRINFGRRRIVICLGIYILYRYPERDRIKSNKAPHYSLAVLLTFKLN